MVKHTRKGVFFMFKKKNWTVYLFYNGIKIKKIKVNDYKELEDIYVRVYGHKKFFGKNIVGIILEITKLLKIDEENKKIYFGTVLKKGVDL